ncbi:MAG: NusG domain II-containing protein [Clostridia bacterium]|nr:NusG domain II-containing protein [Clostridia bacterium]
MGIDRIKQEKENKFFKKGDILVYSIIALIIVALFLIVFIPRNNDQITAFVIKYDNIQVCEYNFDTDTITYNQDYIKFEKESQSVYIITFSLKDDEDFNIIRVDLTTRNITCEDSDCSHSKDCTHMRISQMGDSIICVPHKLIISPVGESEILDPVIG